MFCQAQKWMISMGSCFFLEPGCKASHIIAALPRFFIDREGDIAWTHPGSQGWRPVGGFVLHGALKEVNIPHRLCMAV